LAGFSFGAFVTSNALAQLWGEREVSHAEQGGGSGSASANTGAGPERLVDVVRRIKIVRRSMLTVALVTSASRADLVELLALGTDAILMRSIVPDDLLVALHAICRREVVIAPALRMALGVEEISAPVPDDAGRLTHREREVLTLLAAGRSNREIASALFVTLATVKTHLAHIYDKLGARNRNEALSRAVHLGLLN